MMRTSKKHALSVAMSVLIFAGPFMAATPAYADAKLEQIQTKKEEQANTNAKTFKERMAEAANKVSNMEEGEAYVPGGTQLNVELVNELTSKKARKGDFIRFKMLDNLILNNVVIIPAGTEVEGMVTDATSSGLFGRAGKLILSIDKVKTLNGVTIPLEYMGRIEAGSDGGAVAVAVAVSLVGVLFMRGKNVTIQAGTKFAAKVKNDTDLHAKLTDLKTVMSPEKPHGVAITIK